MAKLNDDEKRLLEELQARLKEPDADEDYEIEVYDTSAGKGARIPYKTGKNWLFDVFGIGDAPASAAGEEGGPGGDAPPAGASDKGSGGKGGAYFNRRG